MADLVDASYISQKFNLGSYLSSLFIPSILDNQTNPYKPEKTNSQPPVPRKKSQSPNNFVKVPTPSHIGKGFSRNDSLVDARA